MRSRTNIGQDSFWGIGANKTGNNWLGKILTLLRKSFHGNLDPCQYHYKGEICPEGYNCRFSHGSCQLFGDDLLQKLPLEALLVRTFIISTDIVEIIFRYLPIQKKVTMRLLSSEYRDRYRELSDFPKIGLKITKIGLLGDENRLSDTRNWEAPPYSEERYPLVSLELNGPATEETYVLVWFVFLCGNSV